MSNDEQDEPKVEKKEIHSSEGGIPEWVEISNDTNTVNTSSDGPSNGILDQLLDEELTDYWEKEIISEADEVQTSNLLSDNTFSNATADPQNDLSPSSNSIIEIDKMAVDLPKWLENVIDVEELKDTSKLVLKIIPVSPVKGNEPVLAQDVLVIPPADELLKSISTKDLNNSDTQPTFIKVISQDQDESGFRIVQPSFAELFNLLNTKQDAQAYKLGQQLILETDNLDLFIQNVGDWLKQNPSAYQIWHLLGDAQMRNDQPSEAIKSFSEAKRLISR